MATDIPSDDNLVSSKENHQETTEITECVSLTIPHDSSVETGKINGDFTVETPDIGACVLKELVCTTTNCPTSSNIMSSSSQIILTPSSSDAVERLSDSFDSHSAASPQPQTTVTTDVCQNIESSATSTSEQLVCEPTSAEDHVVTVASMVLNPDLPAWAVRLKDCEMIGDCYRGYVNTEAELDLLLSAHKEHTRSCWGTRQSPSSAKPSVRLMWKSQYVPYDGVPFLNSGRRATVMECQYGPRRKGNKVKVEFNDTGQPVKRAHKPTCPARIYIKKVQKFPEFRIDPHYEGTASTRQAQERALAALRQAGIENSGEERYYVQFPLEVAHQYHSEDDDILFTQSSTFLSQDQISPISRLNYRVVEKINELVARGVTGIYEVKHGVIQYVETELFRGRAGEVPARHDKTYFPTITDLQNHIHLAKVALDAGTLATLPPPDSPPVLPRKAERNRKRKHSEPRRVRTLKTTTYDSLGTLCVQGDQLGINGEGNLQTAQGQVFVMTLPTTSNNHSLFTASSDSEPTTPLNDDKTPVVQMHVVTVPVTASSYLGQQNDGSSLSLPGEYLSLSVNALPSVTYSNDELSSSEKENNKSNGDSMTKEIASPSPSLIPPTDNDTSQKTGQDNPASPSGEILHTTTTSSAPMSPTGITCIYDSDIPMCDTATTSEPVTITNVLQNVEKTAKDPILVDTIDKNTNGVDDIFQEENQLSKASSDFSSAHTDIIACYTEQSYNSSLDIIKTHEGITEITTSSNLLEKESNETRC